MSDSTVSSSDDSSIGSIYIVTRDEMLRHGLELLGWSAKKLDRKSKKKDEKQSLWFRREFGAAPHVVAQIWEDLQTTNIEAAMIQNATKNDLSQLLYTLQFMKC